MTRRDHILRKMITHLRRCLAIVLIVAAVALGYRCPTNRGCICEENVDESLFVDCRTRNNTGFTIQIKPDENKIKMQCINSPDSKWSDFSLDMVPVRKWNETDDWKIMQFVACDLPGNRSLGNIAQLFNATRVDKLYFQSYKDLSLTLTRHHLSGFQNLKELVLSSNNVTYATNNLLAGLDNLTGLNLIENNLKNLTKGFFDHTPALQYIELGNNDLRSIEAGLFEKLKNLTFLNLWGNSFVDLKPGSLDGPDALRTLGLNRNYLVRLPEGIFASLSNLEVINLSRNNFTYLPPRLLQNNTKLRNVVLTDNRRNMTTLQPGFFANLPQLKNLKLMRNGLVVLPENLLWGSSSLTTLNLEQNYLKTLPLLIFRDAKELLELTLTFNDLEYLPDNIFSKTNKLEKLNLSKNRITSISSFTFSGLSELKELNMEQNQLTTISLQTSVQKLKIIRMSNNHLQLTPFFLDEFGGKSPFVTCVVLEELYLAHNNISEIFGDWMLNSYLRILDLAYNNISKISFRDLQFISNKIRVNLTHNNIKHIDMREAESFASLEETVRDDIILVGDNPLHCGCGVYDLLRYLEGKVHPNVHKFIYIAIEHLKCETPEYLRGMQITDLRSESLKCPSATCPEKCDCWFKPDGNTLILNCSHRNLTKTPSDINLLVNSTDRFERYEFDYTGNKLTAMPNLKLKIEPVKILNLSHNSINDVSLEGLPSTLEVLELHNNNISRLSHEVLEFLKNSSLTRLTLHNNPWECDCDVKELSSFIRTEYVAISNLSQMMCRGKNISVLDISSTDICPFDTIMIISCSVAVSLAGLLIGTFGLLYYKYQRQIKVWLFARQWCLWFVTEEELDKEKLYDAFVSYSHKDCDFVEGELVSKLENGPTPFKLCLHYRDWLPGEWIPANIARSVEDSRRTIVVLSPNFLESVWGRMEFRAAHCQALSEGRARVILILYGDIGPTDDLDPELKAYISMNTYVKWGDPWFWDKLRYALPHQPKQLSKISTVGKIFENQALYLQAGGEKKELIFSNASAETSPTTTPPADTLKTFICDQEAEKKKLQSNGFLRDSGKMNDNVKILLLPEQLIKLSNRECVV